MTINISLARVSFILIANCMQQSTWLNPFVSTLNWEHVLFTVWNTLKYIGKGEFSALMTQVVNLKLIKLNLMLLIQNRCLPSNSNVFGFSRKEAWKGLGNTKKGASNVHHSSYMASTPIRSTTTTHRWGCLHPLEKMQEEEWAHGVWNDNHFIPMVCLYHGLNCAL